MVGRPCRTGAFLAERPLIDLLMDAAMGSLTLRAPAGRLDPQTGWPIEGGIFAENKDDVKDWIQKKINPQGQVPPGPLFMHHLWKEADADHALEAGTPILPLEDEYKSNILYVRGP